MLKPDGLLSSLVEAHDGPENLFFARRDAMRMGKPMRRALEGRFSILTLERHRHPHGPKRTDLLASICHQYFRLILS